jgi:hypothetical protein
MSRSTMTVVFGIVITAYLVAAIYATVRHSHAISPEDSAAMELVNIVNTSTPGDHCVQKTNVTWVITEGKCFNIDGNGGVVLLEQATGTCREGGDTDICSFKSVFRLDEALKDTGLK